MVRVGTLYFAYGCNMDARALSGVVGCPLEPGRAARARDWRLAFNVSDDGRERVAGLVQQEGCVTYGVVYRLPHDALGALDAFEGAPDHYRRATLWVEPVGRRARQAALAYLPQPAHSGDPGRPAPGYLERLIRGGVRGGLPAPYLEWVRNIARDAKGDCYRG